MIFLTVLAGVVAGKLFDLDKHKKFEVPVGGSMELDAYAEFSKAHSWFVEEICDEKLSVETLKPKKIGKKPGPPDYSAFRFSCSKDCEVGEEFHVTLVYRDRRHKVDMSTKVITIEVVPANDEL